MIVIESDFTKIIQNTNKIDMMLDQFKQKIPYSVWLEMNDLNVERAAIFEKYVPEWDEL